MPRRNSYSQYYGRNNQNNKSNNQNNNSNNQNDNNIKKIIKYIDNLEKLSDMKPKDYADIGGYADLIAKELYRKLNTNQLRKFFGAVRSIEKNKKWEDIEPELYLLKPKLAVSLGRKLIPEEFYNIMKVSMKKIDIGTDEEKLENFDTFVKFLEAIVAYHKYYAK